MGASSPKSIGGWTEQALCDVRRRSPLGDIAEDAVAFETAGLPAQEEAKA